MLKIAQRLHKIVRAFPLDNCLNHEEVRHLEDVHSILNPLHNILMCVVVVALAEAFLIQQLVDKQSVIEHLNQAKRKELQQELTAYALVLLLAVTAQFQLECHIQDEYEEAKEEAVYALNL